MNTIVGDSGRVIGHIIDHHYVPVNSPNDLSAFSYKARTQGCSEVSVLYAYDIELMEPVCAEVFPGNSIAILGSLKNIHNAMDIMGNILL